MKPFDKARRLLAAMAVLFAVLLACPSCPSGADGKPAHQNVAPVAQAAHAKQNATKSSQGAASSQANTVRFVQITDVHFTTNRKNSRGRMLGDSKALLIDAVDAINSMGGVDFVMFTGDFIDGASTDQLDAFAKEANKLTMPWFWTTGNHDIGPGGLSRKTFLAGMNKINRYIQPDSTCYAFAKGSFLFFSMDGASDSRVTSEGWFSDECFGVLTKWLTKEPGKPAVIFQHFPLLEPFSSKDHGVKNRKQYLALLDAHPNAAAVFSGHYHASKIQKKNGVLHVSSPALVQYPNAFRVVDMKITPQGTVMDIKTVNTRLTSVREASRKQSPAALLEGKDTDRNATFTIKPHR